MQILVLILFVGVIGGFAFAARAGRGADIGSGLGKKHMKEFDLDDEPKEYHE